MTDSVSSHRNTDTATETAYFSINGMHTQACESYLERRATRLDGVSDAAASYTAEMIRVTYDPDRVGRDAIEETLSAWGYRASDPTPAETPAERNDFDFDHLRTIFSVIAVSPIYIIYAAFFYPVYLGFLPSDSLDNNAVFTGLYGPVAMFTTITVLGVGFPILRSAVISLRERQLTLDVLIALTALSAYAYSIVSLFFLDRLYLFFDVATSIIVLATIANHARARYKRRAVQDLTDVVDDAETTARRLHEDGTTETVSIGECVGGDHVLVRPGERIPLDGTIVEGRGTVNEALITGEARPQRKVPGDDVVGGSVVADGAFEVAVSDGATSTLDRLRGLVWDRQTEGHAIDRLTDRVAATYTPLVVVLAVLTLGAWAALGATPQVVVRTALIVLVVACPVALTLVTPLAIGRGLATAAARDVPVLDQTILERVTDADVVAFDKTGTLTTGEMRVAAVHTTETEADALLRRASAVESRSSHPIATAIRERAPSDSPSVEAFERHRYGVTATVDGEVTAVGNPWLFDALDWKTPVDVQDAIESIREKGAIPTVIGRGGVARGVVAIEDEPRPDWEPMVSAFAEAGRRVVVITGDDSAAARHFEDHPAVDAVHADVAPEAKEGLVRQLRDEYGTVAMVGDGTNDAPALAAADLGVAMVSGSDFTATVAAALVTADDLSPVRSLFAIARGTRRRLRENLALALAMPAVGLPLAVTGYVTPLVATSLTAVGIVLVLVNSRRSLTLDDVATDA
ncbi:heavy metal translocating P-type ATPase [Halocalculus aciditolerans]|uniref:Heavy metal translocating P-type ATPase n=1 Tax=Halocalculus aciditolerans TaxID=1383812 RepID=A0A830FG86_9EURY|nr:cation-translocating P-type ATPase [Halocalculus aciditolerans]GGL71561.1 heavy metal translocating P-type ATPase [Halocalculus aciditolerans]